MSYICYHCGHWQEWAKLIKVTGTSPKDAVGKSVELRCTQCRRKTFGELVVIRAGQPHALVVPWGARAGQIVVRVGLAMGNLPVDLTGPDYRDILALAARLPGFDGLPDWGDNAT